MVPTIGELAEMARAHPVIVSEPDELTAPSGVEDEITTRVTRCHRCGAPLSLQRDTCRFCGEAIRSCARARGIRARRVAPTVRSQARAKARTITTRRVLDEHRPVHPTVSFAFVAALTVLAVLVAVTQHVVIGGMVIGLGVSLYLILHEASIDRAERRSRVSQKTAELEISVERCELCGASMHIRASWPKCDYCRSTGAPSIGLEMLLEKRAADAWAGANDAFDELRQAHDAEVGSATLLAELMLYAMLVVVIVANVIDALG